MHFGPVDSTQSPHAQLHTLPLDSVAVQPGFWSARQTMNRQKSLRHGYNQLIRSGNFNNLRLAAGGGEGRYRTPVFMDSDVYKWLEAVGYDLAIHPDDDLRALAEEAIDLLEAAQMEDGYLNSYWQVVEPDRRWVDIDNGHELYCAGHLIQAAVAYHRGTGDTRLLDITRRFVDHIDRVFGPGKRGVAPGHPEIEMALVELYRATGERRYLDLAGFFVDERGKDFIGEFAHFEPAYYQDRVPVRETDVVEGHAVRQLYLTTGVADIFMETGEQALMDALLRQWHDFTAHKMHVTGGAGARHRGESFGEAYELPNDYCYCETCAQIASVMWNWRMLLITGERRYADLIERTLYNGFLSGISLDGNSYFYVNPLLSRGTIERPEWYGCACCPPNVMRTLASIGHYVATTRGNDVQIHQYMNATVNAGLKLRMETNFPWDGNVTLTVTAVDDQPHTLSLRIPAWCAGPALAVNGERQALNAPAGYAILDRTWQPGDVVTLSLPMEPTLLAAHPRVDPTRGSVAILRGPLVYCLEEPDQPAEVDLMDVAIDPDAALTATWQPELLEGVVTIAARGASVDVSAWDAALYRDVDTVLETYGAPVTLTAIPYYAWANREMGKMRVWIPRMG